MHICMIAWDDLRLVLAIQRAGSLSGAARALACNQSTVTRRLAALQAGLDDPVLERRGGGYVLTGVGERLQPMLTAIEEQALAAERALRGAATGTRGVVRLTTTETVATYLIAP